MMHYLPGRAETRGLDTDALRDAFLVDGLFVPGGVVTRFVDLDRVVVGGAVPLDAPLRLVAPPEMAADSFTERREVGVLNVGGAGAVVVGGERIELGMRDALYVGRGSGDLEFESADAADPARFYLVSYPARETHPTTSVAHSEA